ncbi:MAG: NFACT RNA binding domain-containing protein [Eubacteriales bacterium]|nr:NFACT RNA binding domain-containing protein [Eubacteriales bacterium]
MAYDGLFIRASVNELNKKIINSKIIKIIEPKRNTLEFCLKNPNEILTLSISTLPNCPFILLNNEKNNAPYIAPAFTMIMRKYLSGGIIIKIEQIEFERIIKIQIKNTTEIGELEIYNLYVELMGKYSNVILTNEEDIIIDAMKKSTSLLEDKRFIFPKEKYDLSNIIKKEIYTKSLEKTLNYEELKNLPNVLNDIIKKIDKLQITPNIIYDGSIAKDFYIFLPSKETLNEYKKPNVVKFKTTSDILLSYYEEKSSLSLFSIEKNKMYALVDSLIEKSIKKINIKEKDLQKCENYEKYKLFGELILTFLYDKNRIKDSYLICDNYYDNGSKINVPIDINISLVNNANKYFNKYNKLKRTIEKSTPLLIEEKNTLSYLYSIKDNLSYISNSNDLFDIKKEIEDNFHIKNTSNKNKIKSKKTSLPHITHFVSSDNIDIYIGKNNLQNEYLTFSFAKKNDTWFHVKNASSSHVIVKCDIDTIPKNTLLEAASLCAFYSSKQNEKKVEVDYTSKKNLSKVKGKQAGFCIYHTNMSIMVEPKIMGNLH